MSDLIRVDLSRRKPGNKILIDTENSVYEIDIIDDKLKCMISGSGEFLEETEILLIGCTGHKGFLVFGEGIEFAYTTEDGCIAHGHTSPITSCRLSGITEDGDPWYFEVWEGERCENTSTTQ